MALFLVQHGKSLPRYNCGTAGMGHQMDPDAAHRIKQTPFSRSRLKNRILVQGQGGGEYQPAGMHEHVEDLKRETNADIGPKDIFEMASKKNGMFADSSVTAQLPYQTEPNP